MRRSKKPYLPAGRALNANEFHTVTPEILKLASSFRVSYFFGRGAWDHHEEATLEKAAETARKMNLEYARYGREALIYARFPNGWAILVPKTMLPPPPA